MTISDLERLCTRLNSEFGEKLAIVFDNSGANRAVPRLELQR